jgi:GH25 family lysozyme M1 (1,4-beta-N-acetylmuramidase)
MRFVTPALAFFAAPFLSHCGADYGRVGLHEAPKIVNVSAYDPKERQRNGDSFSPHDVSALQRNGAHGLIARCGKGGVTDAKCADFLASADRQGMKLGTYYFVLKSVNPTRQADHYIDRLRQIATSRGLQGRKILLVGDFDTKSSPADLVAFIDRVEQRTGVLPAVYLENSDRLRKSLSRATPAQKRRIAQCPYWIALYSPDASFKNPRMLMKSYDIWNDWAMWQYAGVEWQGRSVPKHFHHGPWRAPRYFGTMDRPLEHNAFNGSVADLNRFWDKHSWTIR